MKTLPEIHAAEITRLDVQIVSLKAELAESRKYAAQLRGTVELLEQVVRENADVERLEIAAVLETARRARAGELLP